MLCGRCTKVFFLDIHKFQSHGEIESNRRFEVSGLLEVVELSSLFLQKILKCVKRKQNRNISMIK